MNPPKKLVLQLCDLQTCASPNKSNSQHQLNVLSEESNDITNIQLSYSDSVCSFSNKKSRDANGLERNFLKDKKLVVELCDFMVCYRENCDVPEYKKCRRKGKIQEVKKRKADKQYCCSRKKDLKYKVEISEDDSSGIDEGLNDKEVSDDEISDITKVSSDEDSDIEEDADDSDWEEETETAKRRKEKEKQKKVKQEKKNAKVKEGKQTKNLSSYELTRQKNVEDKLAFLKSLRMDEIVEELEETAKAQRKPYTKKPVGEVSRRSKRMENLTINLSEKAIYAKVYSEAKATPSIPELPLVYSFEDAFCGDEKSSLYYYDKYFKNVGIDDQAYNTKSIPLDLGRFDPTVCTTYNIPFRLSSVAFHPVVDKTIILAGSLTGQIALWNIDTDPYLFAPHTDLVTLIKSNPESPSQIVSSSYDGTLRLTDIEKKLFVEIFKEDIPCIHFDFISPTEFLVAQKNGCVSMVDSREKRSRSGLKLGRIAAQWKYSDESIRSVSVHPIKKELCLSLDSTGCMKVWDMRIQRKSALSETPIDLGVLSASFSPVTGNQILCSSKQTIRVYDSTYSEVKLKYLWKSEILQDRSHKKKKKYGKKALHISESTFYSLANWMPNSDDTFITSNNSEKKTVIINSGDGKEMSHLETLGVVVFQVVHPVHNMLAITRGSRRQVTTAQCKIEVYI